jgi:hypothetical protein
MKRRSSTNDTRVRNPFEVAANWLPGGRCCFWNNALYSEAEQDRLNAWARGIQGKPKENLIINNRAEL